jgi:hypothetical protein
MPRPITCLGMLSSILCEQCAFITLQVWKHIFTGPTSALKTQPNHSHTKKGQAGLNRLEHVTPCTIAYAAIQVSSIDFTVFCSVWVTVGPLGSLCPRRLEIKWWPLWFAWVF